MTQVDLFPKKSVTLNLYGLGTGAWLVHDCADGFNHDDFAPLDAPFYFPLGAHEALSILDDVVVFASIPEPRP